jgi:hypothetical protein
MGETCRAIALSDVLQGIEDALTEEREARSPIAHAFNELEFVNFSLDNNIAGWQHQASFDGIFDSVGELLFRVVEGIS